MRFARTIVLVGVALLAWAVGPLVVVAAALALLHPRVRDWLRPTRRVVVVSALGVALVAGLAVVVPDGWVRIPPGPGAWVTPSYVGRPAAGAQAGPAGESPQVRTRFHGISDCTRLHVDGAGRLVTVCGGEAPVVRLINAESLRPRATAELPGSGCAGRLDVRGEVIVASSARRIFTLAPDDLVVEASTDLADALAEGDCVVGLGVDGDRTWFVSAAGVVGFVRGERVRVASLEDEVARGLTVLGAGVYVAGESALHRVDVVGGTPRLAWRTAYDSGRAGSAPVLLESGLVAVAVNRAPRLQIALHDPRTGAVTCRAEVFEDDEGAADDTVAPAGPGVVVANAHGYRGPLSTALGRTSTRGIARVDADCTVAWTLGMNAPSGEPVVADGLVYAVVKRHSWLGVDAWYLAAIDLDSGRLVWGRRTGLSPLLDPHHGPVTLGPDRTLYVPVLGGIARVRDRP